MPRTLWEVGLELMRLQILLVREQKAVLRGTEGCGRLKMLRRREELWKLQTRQGNCSADAQRAELLQTPGADKQTAKELV